MPFTESNREIVNGRCKMHYDYKNASRRTYRVVIICSSLRELEEEMNSLQKIAISNCFKKK